MGKKKKSKIKKLIQERLKEAQRESSYAKTEKVSKAPISLKRAPKLETKTKEDTESDQIKPNFKRIGFTTIGIAIILIIIFLINLKTPFLNTLADKLLKLFQKS